MLKGFIMATMIICQAPGECTSIQRPVEAQKCFQKEGTIKALTPSSGEWRDAGGHITLRCSK